MFVTIATALIVLLVLALVLRAIWSSAKRSWGSLWGDIKDMDSGQGQELTSPRPQRIRYRVFRNGQHIYVTWNELTEAEKDKIVSWRTREWTNRL